MPKLTVGGKRVYLRRDGTYKGQEVVDVGYAVQTTYPTGQTFERIKSKTAAAQFIRDLKDGAGDTWGDDDAALFVEYKNGSTLYTEPNTRTRDIKVTGVERMTFDNGTTVAYYGDGVRVVYNERYKDWEIDGI